MENYCARLRGETNSKAMEISRMERTALQLLPSALRSCEKDGNTYSKFLKVRFKGKKGREGKAMKSINSRFSVTRVPPIPFYHRRERKQLPFHHPSLCLFTLHTTLEKKPNHSLAVSFGKREKKGKNRWLTTRKNIVEKSPPVDYFFSGVVKDGARGNIDDALNVSKVSCPIFVWSSRKMKARPVLQYT